MNTINKFLIDSSKANPEKLALIDHNSKFTFSELEEKVNRFSSFLNQFQERSVISLLFDNTSEFVVSYLGIINSGNVAHKFLPFSFQLSFYHPCNITRIFASVEITLTTNKSKFR